MFMPLIWGDMHMNCFATVTFPRTNFKAKWNHFCVWKENNSKQTLRDEYGLPPSLIFELHDAKCKKHCLYMSFCCIVYFVAVLLHVDICIKVSNEYKNAGCQTICTRGWIPATESMRHVPALIAFAATLTVQVSNLFNFD